VSAKLYAGRQYVFGNPHWAASNTACGISEFKHTDGRNKVSWKECHQIIGCLCHNQEKENNKQ
jgi:hypothetical protein